MPRPRWAWWTRSSRDLGRREAHPQGIALEFTIEHGGNHRSEPASHGRQFQGRVIGLHESGLDQGLEQREFLEKRGAHVDQVGQADGLEVHASLAQQSLDDAFATVGIVPYIASMWIDGVMKGLMWRSINTDGTLTYSFVEKVKATFPFYVVRLYGGCCTSSAR